MKGGYTFIPSCSCLSLLPFCATIRKASHERSYRDVHMYDESSRFHRKWVNRRGSRPLKKPRAWSIVASSGRACLASRELPLTPIPLAPFFDSFLPIKAPDWTSRWKRCSIRKLPDGGSVLLRNFTSH